MRSIDEFPDKDGEATVYNGSDGNQCVDEHIDEIAPFVGKVAKILVKSVVMK